ncbi:Tryptophan synthase alpha chain [Candidatus Hydrogenisulfobacillus filiaventi]|uniref:Tryptophan synthase alpha chain n=1 Tax=Candidatus Hydrogenisulfobacillus filiaventi TaxID=2707344 RepID=A0A6F8ZHG8_9FIRM|nr:tryptophan synthase subunit alpha [Bacillota bacterium]CAB1129163.1 Tryptophan synthase alpha chain [Candidatus Hydrogenisulfobacillus filiaventi]
MQPAVDSAAPAATGVARIAEAFARARAQGRAALIPYVTAGVPDLPYLVPLLERMAQAGADLIEVGIPFSDPLADGPVLQRAAALALARGTRVRAILETLGRQPLPVPVVFLTYVNPVLRFGPAAFLEAARAAGVSGVIIPDLPWIEAGEMATLARRQGLALIPLVAPTSTDRHVLSLKRAEGFIYGVSVTGVTGVRQTVDPGVVPLVERVRAHSTLPVAIGFGISTPEQAAAVGRIADGVIVGSALVRRILDAEPGEALNTAAAFVGSLAAALRAGG